MKSLRVLKAAGLILAAVVLGLMTVQGSYALWNSVVPANAGTIQAADFSILGNDGVEMTPLPIEFAAGQLTRGGKATKYVEVTNNVNVTADSPLRIQATLTGLGNVIGFDGLTVTAAPVAAKTNCDQVPAGSYSTVPEIPLLVKGIPQGICLKVELSTKAQTKDLARTFSIQPILTVAQLPVSAAK